MSQNTDSKVVDIKTAVEARKKEEADLMAEAEKNKGDGDGGVPDSEFIMRCLRENELGDGNLFKHLYREDFVFNKAADCWMSWEGHHWTVDTMDNALASVEGVAQVFQDEARKISKEIYKLESKEDGGGVGKLKAQRKSMNKRVAALRSSSRRKNCLTFAHTSQNALAIRGDEIDQKPWLIACKNGVLNLRTGELEPGRHRDMLLKASPVEWKGIDAPCETWEKSILEIFSGSQPLVECFQRVCGYAMVGKVLQSILVVMTGRGRNGKSLIVETLAKVLGPLSGAIPSEMLLDQFRASSAGPSPDIMSLRGLRMAFASETDDGCKISPSRVKWLTGNDTITGRNPHDKHPVQFKPSHTLFLLTNHKPHAPAEDFAFWERIVLFPFDLSFVDREPRNENECRADPNLARKLEDELPGILAWMVRGCLSWQVQGVAPPAAVKDAVKDYQRKEDSIADFIDECCIVGEEFSVGATAVFQAFEDWWKVNVSNFVPKQKRFGGWFSKRFEKRKEGTVKYFGVGLLADQDEPGFQ
jgi:putative DNA primase/helicase